MQKFIYWIVARHEGVNEQLLLENPLRIPVFTTSEKAGEFGAVFGKGVSQASITLSVSATRPFFEP
jgi:hypothetical protein